MDFQRDLNIIKQQLEEFKNAGYNRICIPGGTSKDGDHYSGAVIPYWDVITKLLWIVGVPYDSQYYKTNDENGHTKKSGEHPIETVIREVTEETALSIDPRDLVKLDCSFSIPDNRVKVTENKMHAKNFYLAEKFSGNLFNFNGPKPNPIDGETSSPIMLPASMFLKVVFHPHQKAAKEAIRRLIKSSEELAPYKDYYTAMVNMC